MTAGARALLTGIIDYAGMFPPARLPLDLAIRNYARYCREPEAWMLGRFICPAARLEEVSPFLEEGAKIAWSFSALGRSTNTLEEFKANLGNESGVIRTFADRHARQAAVAVYECKPPEDFYARPEYLDDLLALFPARTFFEVSLTGDWRKKVITLARALGRGSRVEPEKVGGIKLRCGGLEPAAVPRLEQAGFVLSQCRDAGLDVKFTAGLHHPIRHLDPGLKIPIHGFLNLFLAGVLAHVHGLEEDQVGDILADQNPANFVFGEEGVSWKNLSATKGQVTDARNRVTSFGSCSWEEPCADLKSLKIL